jgi:hypothetical protein
MPEVVMTKEDFYRIRSEVYANAGVDKFDFDLMMLRVVMKAVEEEREACAQIAHDTYEGFGPHAKGVDFVKQHIAIRIRERGVP